MYYKLAQLTLGVLLKIIFRPWAVGARNVPRQGAVILASNREPLDFSRFYGQAFDHRVLRAVTDEVMRAIGELSGQEYVDMYAQLAKEKLAAGAAHPEASSPLPGTAPAPPGTLAGTPPETRS